MITWSYGGGVQSVAIGVLIREGVLPKPDLAAIVDNGRLWEGHPDDWTTQTECLYNP
jgi:hypothetical protein